MSLNKKYSIMLIEDDPVDRLAFKRTVNGSALPYDYEMTDSVAKAKALLKEKKFDVVIADYNLPDGTAFDIFDWVGDAITIFATGAGDEELAVKAMKSGAYDYLIKDHSRNYLKVLPERIRKAIQHKQAEDQLKQYHENLELLVKERAEELAKEKEMLSVTLSSMGDGVVVTDADTRIVLFNKVAEDLSGWKFTEVEGRLVEEVIKIVDDHTNEQKTDFVDRVLSSRKLETGSFTDSLVSKDGRLCPVALTGAPMWDHDGLLMGVVLVFRDVSSEREIDRMKTDFVSSVSHELRTPLTSIKAYISTIMRDDTMDAETRKHFLSIINEESNNLLNLIESLLNVSRLDSGGAQMINQDIDMSKLIKQISLALKPQADKNNVQMVIDVGDDLPQLTGDESKIQSVVTNLVSNAIKFTPSGGKVTILSRVLGNELIIRVSDTGVGIPKEDLKKIFDRFYRIHRPGKQIQGTGLGLAIVKKIIDLCGGRIEVESEISKGTTFTVALPATTQIPQYVISD